jgi:ketosteroid isomerase-like protein
MGQVWDAWQTLDPSKAAPFYSPDAGAVFFDFAPLQYVGWNAYAAGTGEFFKTISALAGTLNDDAWIEVHGDVAIATVTGMMTLTNRDASRQSFEFRWTAFWKRVDKVWLIAHEHLSVPLAMPGVPEE